MSKIGALMVALALLSVAAWAQPDPERELGQLKERAKARYPDLVRLKQAGKVGETFQGLVAAVKDIHLEEKLDPSDPESDTIKAFLEKENRDRGRLYQILAAQQKVTPEEVARQNALRTFNKAEPEEYLRQPDGRWIQRKDIKKKE